MLALITVAVLFLHVASKGWTKYIYPLVAIVLWSADCIVRLIRTLHLRAGQGHRQENHALITIHTRLGEKASISGLTFMIWPRRPVRARGGYYYCSY
jgi:hypothetical protein